MKQASLDVLGGEIRFRRLVRAARMAEEPVSSTSPEPAEQADERPLLPVPVLAAAIFAAAALAGLFWLTRRPAAPPPSPPSQEALAYLSQLGVSELHLSAEGNFLGQDVVYVDGKITNGGSKTVRRLRVRLHFYDTMSQVILREEQDIIRPAMTPLQPGETHAFQLRFDRLPPAWNVQLPQFQLVSLQLE